MNVYINGKGIYCYTIMEDYFICGCTFLCYENRFIYLFYSPAVNRFANFSLSKFLSIIIHLLEALRVKASHPVFSLFGTKNS